MCKFFCQMIAPFSQGKAMLAIIRRLLENQIKRILDTITYTVYNVSNLVVAAELRREKEEARVDYVSKKAIPFLVICKGTVNEVIWSRQMGCLALRCT